MQATQGKADRARRLNLENRSKGKPSQEIVDEALKRLDRSGTEKARSIVPSQATQNPRTEAATAQAKSPQPQPQSPAPQPQPQPQAPAVNAKRPAYSEQMARAQVDELIRDFKQSGQFPGADLKNICDSVPQADVWFADAFDALKTRLSGHPKAFAAFEWMRSEIAGAARNYVFKKESPEAIVEKWKLELGDLAVTRTWIRELNKLKSAPTWREVDPYA